MRNVALGACRERGDDVIISVRDAEGREVRYDSITFAELLSIIFSFRLSSSLTQLSFVNTHPLESFLIFAHLHFRLENSHVLFTK